MLVRQKGSPTSVSAVTVLILEAFLRTPDPLPSLPDLGVKAFGPVSLPAPAQRPQGSRLSSALRPRSRNSALLPFCSTLPETHPSYPEPLLLYPWRSQSPCAPKRPQHVGHEGPFPKSRVHGPSRIPHAQPGF